MSEEKDVREAERQEPQEPKKEKKQKKAKRSKLLYPANKKGKHVMHFLNFLRFLFYPIHFLVYPYKLYGHKKVGLGAYIYVGNHYCNWDIFYPARTTGEGVHFLMKESLLHVPFVGYFARHVGAIPAMRNGRDMRTVMDAIKVLQNGEKVSMFPEGTRNKEGDGETFLPFHGGAAFLAIKTRTPVIPFVICNRPRVFHMTHVVFGEPMELSEYYDRKLTQADFDEADEKLKNRLYELRAEHREMLASKKRRKKSK